MPDESEIPVLLFRANPSSNGITRGPVSPDSPSPRDFSVALGLHRTLDVQFREDDCRLRRGHAPAVMAILRRAALNMVKTFQQQFEPDVSMGLLRDHIGRQPWLLAPSLP